VPQPRLPVVRVALHGAIARDLFDHGHRFAHPVLHLDLEHPRRARGALGGEGSTVE
jgi:hypothetical protein